jgi:16S rRNA (guanine527-N7)-methyltransferase
MTPLDALAAGGAEIVGRPLTALELESFDQYLKLLQKWSRSQRLIGSTDAAWIVENLFLDSLLFLRVLPTKLAAVADVGSGAGLPGIPIKIVRPEVRMTLIESRSKRASFLSAAVRELRLQAIEVVISRAEEVARDRAGEFDAVVMRCAGEFSRLARAIAGLVRPGGVLAASGPSEPRLLELGDWVSVPGVHKGQVRRFVRYQVGE